MAGRPTITVGIHLDIDPRTRAALVALGWTPPPTVRPGHEDCEVDDHGRPYRVCTDAPPAPPPVAQWWRNGDHPADDVGQPRTDPLTGRTFEAIEGAVVRYFRHPGIPGDTVCGTCGRRFHDHGWIDQGPDGITVCPGDLVITWRGRYTTAPAPTTSSPPGPPSACSAPWKPTSPPSTSAPSANQDVRTTHDRPTPARVR